MEEEPVLWAKILTVRHPQGYEVRVKDDSGTDPNWIHPRIVEECEIQQISCSAKRFIDFQGNSFECTKMVRVRWSGKKDNSFDETFYVAPTNSRFDLLFGKIFGKKHGCVQKHCSPKSESDARPFEFDKMKVSIPN
jgi:hypothetical protein